MSADSFQPSPKVCILTDSSVQFPSLSFPGNELVSIIPLRVQMGNQIYIDGKDIRLSQLPASARGPSAPAPLPPTVEDFCQFFAMLGRRYDEIVTILIASHLNPAFEAAKAATNCVRGPATIHLIDSQTTAVGMGLLVQIASQAALQNLNGAAISRLVRGSMSNIYSVFCVQSISYLYRSGQLDPAQAIVGEMLGVTPFFNLENGRLVPIQKVRSSRHLVDILHEFIGEFSDPQHIALLQGYPAYEQEARNLRERLNGDYPDVSFSEHNLSPALGAIFGPRSLGLFVMESSTDSEKDNHYG